MEKIPIVSVVMPSFNSARFIERSIQSVLDQNFIDWELIIVDGGSSDETLDLIENYVLSDRRLRVIRSADDKGPAHARSIGIKHSRGEFIAFLDCDDIWLRNKLAHQIEFMRRGHCDFSYTQYRVMSSDGRIASWPVSIPHEVSYPAYFYRRGICCSTVVIRRSLFSEKILDTYGSWLAEDTHWWLMLMRDGATAYRVFEPLVLYRDSTGSLSKNRVRNQVSVWQIYRIQFGMSSAAALFAYISYLVDVVVRRMRYKILTRLFGSKLVVEILK